MAGLFCFFVSTDNHYVFAGPTVLFDEGHGQRFIVAGSNELDLTRLASTFTDAGYTVRTTKNKLATDMLADVDVLVISGAFDPLEGDEVETIHAFLGRGGRLCVMLHIAPPLTGLMHRFGVVASSSVIRETSHVIEKDPLNFYVTQLATSPLFEGIGRFALYGGWALNPEKDNVTTIATTGPEAWVDLNGDKRFGEGDARQAFAVAVAGTLGSGRFVIFGDDAIFQNKFIKEENLILAGNLVKWLE
ncbi:MAG: DUF4350 domain-containing protein [Geobacter sp.]|nr:DUF4350 domain-containing protein [Geobacter sp.]